MATEALIRSLVALLLVLVPTASAAGRGDDVPANDPSKDPYTDGGKPELMAQAGVVSYGPFEFAATDTKTIEELLPAADIRWIETKHFQVGFALGAYQVKQKDKKRILAELTEMQTLYPRIDPKTKFLDPWLRAHMAAHRAELLYERFLKLVGKQDSDFPDGTKPWDTTGTYMGEGPFLGMKGKFELLILPNETSHSTLLVNQFGLGTRGTQRWHIIERSTLIAVMQQYEGSLREDEALHAHIAFNLGINFLDSYRYYAYDLPIWLREGVGHFFEREISPKYNTFDADEGSAPITSKKDDWRGATSKLVQAGKAPRTAELLSLTTFSGLDLDAHFTVWSRVEFLATQLPEKFTLFLDEMKGRTNAEGMTDGSNLDGAHRDAFKEVFGWSYAEFDAAWAEWVAATY